MIPVTLPTLRQTPWGVPLNTAVSTVAGSAQTAEEVTAIAQSVADTTFEGIAVDLGDAVTAANVSSGPLTGAALSATIEEQASTRRDAAPVALATAAASNREYPRLRTADLWGGGPMVLRTQQAAPSMYWPCLADLSLSGGSGVVMLYSTDHAGSSSSNGIYKMSAPSIEGPWTSHGKIWVSPTSNTIESETPTVVWVPEVGLYYVYYQTETTIGLAEQWTELMTSPDLVTFTFVGRITHRVPGSYGQKHTGYFRPFRLAGMWFAYSLYGGGDESRWALWRSRDGLTWEADGKVLGRALHFMRNLAGADNTWVFKWQDSNIVDWRGKQWIIMPAVLSLSGGSRPTMRLVTAPLSSDLRSMTQQPVDITPSLVGWEGGSITAVGIAGTQGNRLYIPYQGVNAQSGIGLMEVY